MRREFKVRKLTNRIMQESLSGDDLYSLLPLDEVLDRILDTVCDQIGFSFAMIALVDEDQQEIQMVKGKCVRGDWRRESHRSLYGNDIQAYLMRTGKTVCIVGKEATTDGKILSLVDGNYYLDGEELFTLDWDTFQKYNHEAMARVLIPIGEIGSIEAGFYRSQHQEILPILVKTLELYAARAKQALQNALFHEQQQQHTTMLTELHGVSSLQTLSQQGGKLLQLITDQALDILHADVVRLYPLEQSGLIGGANQGELRFKDPISTWRSVQDSKEEEEIKLPYNPDIVQDIAKNQKSYYRPDAQDEQLLGGTSYPLFRSFAGVPLQTQGELLGVLCINYRIRHRFSDYERLIIELFAQHAAAVIKSNQLVREQERHKERQRLENELHGLVKSSVRALRLFSEEASAVLGTDPVRARELLRRVSRTTWGILSDIDLVLNNLASEYDNRTLSEQIREEVSRLVGETQTEVVVDLDKDLPVFPIRLSRVLLSVIREAVINALEHGRAKQICVRISCAEDQVCLVVEDDGRGFEPEKERSQARRGLTIMQNHVEAIGGCLRVTSYPEKRTTIRVEIPLKDIDGTE